MKIVTAETIAEFLSRAAASPRKRMNINLHQLAQSSVRNFQGFACNPLHAIGDASPIADQAVIEVVVWRPRRSR